MPASPRDFGHTNWIQRVKSHWCSQTNIPNYSICGLPFFLSGETPDWHSLAHRTEFPGIRFDAEPYRREY